MRIEAVGRGLGRSDIDLAKDDGVENIGICDAMLEAMWSLNLPKPAR